MEWRLGFRFYVFTYLSTQPTTSGGDIFRCTFLPAALLFQCPSGTPSFVARRKIGEKGVSRGCGPLNPRSNVLGHSDVLCANHLATVRLTRLSRLRRSAYPLASACCTAVELMALSQPPNFRPQIRLVILSVPTFSPHYEQYNRVRGNSAKHATDGPKSRKLHPGAHVEKSARLPSKPPYEKPESKGRLWSPLACLSSISFFTQRKIWPPEGLPKRECR